jgi:hypothetical protein
MIHSAILIDFNTTITLVAKSPLDIFIFVQRWIIYQR